MKQQSYPAYKSSGVQWLGDVPVHWEVMALKRIVVTPVTDGPHETPEIYDEGIPFVSAEAIKNDQIDFTKIRGFISIEDHKRYSMKYKPKRNDIYIIKSGATTGNIAMVETDDEFNIWSPLAAIRSNLKICFPRFLFHFVKSREFTTSIQVGWSFGTQQNIGMNVIENLFVTLPPLPEQQAIAAFLDRETGRIDTLVAKKIRLIELLREKRSALISHAVTKGLDPSVKLKPSGVEWLGDVPEHWEIKRLKHIVSMKSGEAITSEEIEDCGEYPVYGGNGFRGYYSNFTHDGHFVLVGRQGALCGNVNYGKGKFWASEHAVVAKPNYPIAIIWLGELLNIMNLNQYSVSAAQPGLAIDKIKELKVPTPQFPEQQSIAAHLNHETQKIDALIAKVEEAITKLKEYRTALISAAVTGKIDVRGSV